MDDVRWVARVMRIGITLGLLYLVAYGTWSFMTVVHTRTIKENAEEGRRIDDQIRAVKDRREERSRAESRRFLNELKLSAERSYP